LLARGFTGREVRCLMLRAHYRETFNFTLDGLHDAKTSLARIDECVNKLREIAGTAAGAPEAKLVEQFSVALADDLNVSAAWGSVFEWVRETNKRLAENSVSAAEAAAALAAWDKVDSVLGVGIKTEADVPAEIVALMEARQAARQAKDFRKSDIIRDELKAKGWVIEDTPKGPKLKKI
jgi:cysteinyl-tRNA synthetase